MISIRKSFLGLLFGALFLLPPFIRAGDADPFSLQNQAAEDPFSTDHQARPAVPAEKPAAEAQLPKTLTRKEEQLLRRIRFTAKTEPARAKPGDVVTLTITGTPLKGNHTYPITQRTPQQDPIQLSQLLYGPSAAFQPIWPVTEPKPEFVPQPDGGPVWLELEKPFTWKQDLYLRPEAKPGAQTLTVTIRLQVCDAKSCTDPGTKYPQLSIPFGVLAGPAAAPSPELKRRLANKREVQVVSPPPNIRTISAEKGAAASAAKGNPSKTRENQVNNLPFLLWSAFTGALLMLLTPCVFPMIPITVNFFLKQSEKEHHRPLPMASVYAGTIILMLTVVMVGLGKVIIELATDPWFNLIFGLVLVLFALSLFGMFELQLPQGLARFTSARESQAGYAGAVFMALTFTITSFTCTGPFIGLILGSMAQARPSLDYQILASLVYSCTFAAPFFLLALFPALLRMLPKSGGWLNTVKVTMGFVELALALKFLANTDNGWNPGNPRLFTYDSVLCAWIALSFACGLYLIGLFRLPHDYPTDHIGVGRLLFAALFIGLAVYLTPLLRDKIPKGILGEKIYAFLPQSFENSSLAWHQDYEPAWKEAVGKKGSGLIFIDFTGVYCTNCRENEGKVFPKPEVRQEMAKYVRVQLYTDTVPNPRLSSKMAKAEAERNGRWRDAIGNLTTPYYVVFQPDKEKPFDEEGNLKGKVVDTRDGTIFDVPDFVRFLKKPLDQLAKDNGKAEMTRTFAARP